MFDRGVLDNDPSRRSLLLTHLSAALEAADPALAVSRSLRRDGTKLTVGGHRIDLTSVRRVAIVALGKASPAMGRAAWTILDGTDRRLLVVSDHAEPLPTSAQFVQGGHPLPNAASERAAAMALELAAASSADDLVLCLISGGGSSLAELPASGLTLEDVRSTGHALLDGGVPIEQANIVRHHLSAFKGGRLAEVTFPARMVTLVLSDIVGNPLPSIASGPTVADPSTFGDALDVLADHHLLDRVPAQVRAHLEDGTRGLIPETPKAVPPGSVTVVVGDLETAALALRDSAERSGIPTTITTTTLSGEAAPTAVQCLDRAGPGLSVFAGETTVTVRGDGVGGRNQEGALAVAEAIDGRSDVVFAAFATDGVDGPTDSAGAIVDGGTAARGRARGLDIHDHLVRNDSHPFLLAAGDLLVTGPTGTNVGDIWLVLRDA
jgi:glycerate 2-kinase